MKLVIPELRTKLKLTEDWTFQLFNERRNSAMLNYLINKNLFDKSKVVVSQENVYSYGNHGNTEKARKIIDECFTSHYRDSQGYIDHRKLRNAETRCYMMTIPKGTILIVDRYYIKGDDFSSITFRTQDIQINGFKKTEKPRFWAKLYEVNNIEFEAV